MSIGFLDDRRIIGIREEPYLEYEKALVKQRKKEKFCWLPKTRERWVLLLPRLHSLESYVSSVYFPRGFLESYKTRSPSKVYMGLSRTPLNWHILYKWIHRKPRFSALSYATAIKGLLSKAWKIVGSIGKPFSGYFCNCHISMLIFSPQVVALTMNGNGRLHILFGLRLFALALVLHGSILN